MTADASWAAIVGLDKRIIPVDSFVGVEEIGVFIFPNSGRVFVVVQSWYMIVYCRYLMRALVQIR